MIFILKRSGWMFFLFVGVFFFDAKTVPAQNVVESGGITVEAAYIVDYLVNTRGGLMQSDTYLSNLDLTLTVDTEKIGWWKNGQLFLYGLDNAGGRKLSGELVGDLQVVSNIEAPRSTRLYEIWYEHFFHDRQWSVLFGIHDYNSSFNVTEYGGLFLNSSFGIQPDMSAGARPSVFPLAAPGVRFQGNVQDQWEWQVGVYDGDPDDPETSEHAPRSDFDNDSGLFFAAEIGYGFSEKNLPGMIKFGLWHNTGEFQDIVNTAQVRDHNTGGYVVIDKMLYQEKEEQGLGAFLQFGMNDHRVNEITTYIGGGFHYQGLFPHRDQDQAGLAVAYARINDDAVVSGQRHRSETVLEATYRMHIHKHFIAQPDLQYVIHPGAVQGRDNVLIAGMRFEWVL